MRLTLIFTALIGSPAFAQTCGLAHPGECMKDIVRDQGGVWTSPLHAKPKDAAWLIPLAGATALALHYDVQAQNTLGYNQTRVHDSNLMQSFYSPYATIGGGAALYLIGLGTHNQHLAETGRLGAEAVIDTSLVVVALKVATNRQRLGTDNNQGQFWPHGTNSFETNSSFPSGHAASAWAMARVVAAEYPSKKVRIAAYALATVVSVSRVTGRDHFPSDVLIGSAFGYLIGGFVIHHHATEKSPYDKN
jgi:PAP2 superfamily